MLFAEKSCSAWACCAVAAAASPDAIAKFMPSRNSPAAKTKPAASPVTSSPPRERSGSIAKVFIGHSFIAAQVEALLDSMSVEAYYLFHTQRHLIGAKLTLQTSFLGEERIRPIGSNDHRCEEITIGAAATHTDYLPVFVV